MSLYPLWSEHFGSMQAIKKTIMAFEGKHLSSEAFQTHNRIYLEHLLERLMNSWQGYQRAFTSFEEVHGWDSPEEEELSEEDQLSHLSKIIGDCETKIRSRIKQLTISDSQPLLKPSEVHLDKFDGDYAEWSSWSNQVKSAVLDTDLPIHSKIELIINALGENIAPSIGRAEGRDQHELDRIWGKLQTLCSNPYDRARTHMGQILDLPVLHKPTDKDFRKIVDTVDFQLRALSRMNFNVNSWDPLIVEILLRKMDKPTIRNWERDRDPQNLPKLKDLLAFFERQVQSIRNLNRSMTEALGRDTHQSDNGANKRLAPSFPRARDLPAKRHHRAGEAVFSNNHGSIRGTEPKKSSNAATQLERPIKCRMECQDNRPHYLWNCKDFRNLTLEERLDRISLWKVCKRCLVFKHDCTTCTALRCEKCNDIHNPILCPKFRVFAAVNSAQSRKQTTSKRRLA